MPCVPLLQQVVHFVLGGVDGRVPPEPRERVARREGGVGLPVQVHPGPEAFALPQCPQDPNRQIGSPLLRTRNGEAGHPLSPVAVCPLLKGRGPALPTVVAALGLGEEAGRCCALGARFLGKQGGYHSSGGAGEDGAWDGGSASQTAKFAWDSFLKVYAFENLGGSWGGQKAGDGGLALLGPQNFRQKCF